jgi:hypothetical protein
MGLGIPTPDVFYKGAFQGDGLRKCISRCLPRNLAWSAEEKRIARWRYERGDHARLPSPWVDYPARVILAACAGAALVVPMLIMAINMTPTKSLITVPVAVFLFGLVASVTVNLSNTEIFLVTAGYAAVLVVFLGVSAPGSS